MHKISKDFEMLSGVQVPRIQCRAIGQTLDKLQIERESETNRKREKERDRQRKMEV